MVLDICSGFVQLILLSCICAKAYNTYKLLFFAYLFIIIDFSMFLHVLSSHCKNQSEHYIRYEDIPSVYIRFYIYASINAKKY